MGGKGVWISVFLDPPGVSNPPAIDVGRKVGEWSELRIKVGCVRNINICPVWRLRLET